MLLQVHSWWNMSHGMNYLIIKCAVNCIYCNFRNLVQDDLIYFFWLGPLINEDMKVSRRWMKYFINFAYHR